MKYVAILTAGVALAGCMEPVPTATSGAVPFAQVMAETEGRPYECVNYDRRTDSCEGLTTYNQNAPNTFATRSRSIFDEQGRVVEGSPVVRVRGDQACIDGTDYGLTLVSGTSDLGLELALAQIDDFLAQQGEICLVILCDGDDYIAQFVSGPEMFTDVPPQHLTFFENPKRLRPSSP